MKHAALAPDGYVLAVRVGGHDPEADAWLARRVGAAEVVECPASVDRGWRRERLGNDWVWVRRVGRVRRGDEVAGEELRVRATAAELADWRARAADEGISLSEWVRARLG